MQPVTCNITKAEWSPKLLIIDDDPNAHDLMDYYLLGVASEVLHASTGREGILITETTPPDVILLDVDMPGMDGFEVCKYLKQSDATRDIPILFLTKDNQEGHIVKALDCGGSDYVTKPFVPIELQARVRSALRSKRASDVLRQQALFDPLTNLANRRAFDEGLNASISDFTRNGNEFSLLLLDLDHFKEVNDTYGHGVGDEVLTQVGMTIWQSCRPYDVAARYGGEEFGLILNQTELSEARNIGQRLLETIRQISITVDGQQLHVTTSAGLVCVSDCHEKLNAKHILHLADTALYEAKRQGRDQLTESASL